MMRKFPKLLAVVLAIAIIICPAMCLTSIAEESPATPDNNYSISYDAKNNAVSVELSATEGFLVALLRLELVGFNVTEDNENAISVTATPFGGGNPGTVVADPDFNEETSVLSLLVRSNESTNMDLIGSVELSIPLTKTAEEYNITLTTVQAAVAGSIVDGVVTAPDALLTFPYADEESGEIYLDDAVAAGQKVIITSCTHINKSITKEEQATCTEDGYTEETCTDCGKVITTPIPALGHNFVCEDYGDGTHVIYCGNECGEVEDVIEDHVDDDADGFCDICDATLEVEEPECQHENMSAWEITQPTKDATGLKTRTCLDCSEHTEEVVIPVPVLDTTMVFRNPNVSVGATLALRFRARTSVLNDATATYKFVIASEKHDTTTMNKVAGEEKEYDIVLNDNGDHYQRSVDISITDVTLNTSGYIVRYNAEGIFEAYSDVVVANPATLLKNMIKDAAEGTTQYKFNVAVTDLLNVAAAAQDYFPTSGKNLNCDLYTAPRANEDIDQKWASKTVGDLTTVDTENNIIWNPGSVISETKNKFLISMGINPAPAPTFVINQASAAGNYPIDYSKLSLTISYTSANDNQLFSDTIAGAEWEDLAVRKNLRAKFSMIAMYDSNQQINTVLTYDGVEVCSSVYTIETYYAEKMSDTDMQDIMTKLAKFSLSTRAYFFNI